MVQKDSQRSEWNIPSYQYDDLWNLDPDKTAAAAAEAAALSQAADAKPFPPISEKDVISFIEEYSPTLQVWQRDILSKLLDEMLYFWPQIETKIMNEGWASYWHQRIIRELDLTSEETIEFAKLNSSVVQPSRHSLNPYIWS